MKKIIFKSCKELGCIGRDCTGFRDAYETTHNIAGCYFDPENNFKRIPGDEICWVEVEEDGP
jgi:hypothetical protein